MIDDLLAAVAQQLGSPQTQYVAKTSERLQKLGLTEDEAKNQIALCLGEALEAMVKKHRGFDEPAYREALDALPLPAEDGEEDEKDAW